MSFAALRGNSYERNLGSGTDPFSLRENPGFSVRSLVKNLESGTISFSLRENTGLSRLSLDASRALGSSLRSCCAGRDLTPAPKDTGGTQNIPGHFHGADVRLPITQPERSERPRARIESSVTLGKEEGRCLPKGFHGDGW
jgi:hypothetical protein